MSASGYEYDGDRNGSRGRQQQEESGGWSGGLSLGGLMDEAARYIGDSGVISGVGAQVRANPVPLALVGIGLAWLMSGRSGNLGFGGSDYRGRSRGGRGRGRGQGGRGGAQHRVGEPTWPDEDDQQDESGSGWTRGALDTVTGAASSAASGVTAAASTVSSSVVGGARYATDAVWHGGEAAYSGATHLGYRTRDILEDEPLILGALGLAVGAAIGAMLPRTEAEDRYLGEYRDRLKEDAEHFVRDQLERGKSVASEALRSARDEADAQGISTAGVREVVGRAREAAQDIARAAVDGAKDAASESGSGSGQSGSGQGGSGQSGSGTSGG